MKKLLQVVIMTLLVMLLSGACAYAQMYQVTTDSTSALPSNNAKTIVKDSGGNYYTVYTATYNSYSHIFVRKSTDNGATWQYWDGAVFNTTGTETPIETSGDYNQASPSIAVDSSNNLHIAWYGKSSASPSVNQIRYSKYSAGSWSSPVDLTSQENNQDNPSMVIDSNNDIHIVWHGIENTFLQDRIRYIKYSGGSWSSFIDLVVNSPAKNNPCIAVDSNNNLHVVWHQVYAGTYLIRYSKFDGTSWSTSVDITNGSYSCYNPSIAVDSSNNLHVAFYGDNCIASNQIRYMKYNGTSWSNPTEVTGGYDQYNPSIAVDNNNVPHIIWYGKSSVSPSYYQIRYSKYIGGRWLGGVDLTSGSYNQTSSSIISDASCIVWKGATNASGVSSSSNGVMIGTQPLVLTPPTNVAATDVANNGDGRDIQVTFTGASDETNVSEYRIYVLPINQLIPMTETIAAGLASTRYVAEAKSGNNGNHTVTLTQGLLDSTGASLGNEIPYYIYVMAVGQNGYSSYANVSSKFTLAAIPAVIGTNKIVTSNTTAGLAGCNGGRTVVKSSDGNWYSTFAARYEGYNHIFVRKSEDGGVTWKYWNGTSFDVTGRETPIEASGDYNQANPCIEVDSSNNVHVVWQGKSSTSTSSDQIRYSKYSGGSWSSAVNLTGGGIYDHCNPSMAIDNANNIHVVWHYGGNSQINYMKYNGTSWSGVTDITNDGTYSQFNASIVADSANNLYLVWIGYTTSIVQQIRYSKYDGSSWSSPVFITNESCNQGTPSIAIDSSNNVYAVWASKSSTSTTYTQIRYSKYSGGSWSSAVDITSGNYNQYNPSIAVDSSNNLHVVWYGKSATSTTYYQVRYINLKVRSSWSNPVNITSGNFDQQYPSIVKGAYGFIWQGNTDNSCVSSSGTGAMFYDLGIVDPATNVTVSDVANNGDGRDIQVTFNGSKDETNISEYRIYVVPTTQFTTFNEPLASSLANSRYFVEAKTGNNASHTVALTQASLDSMGVPIVNSREYRILVLAVGQNGYNNALSLETNPITLTDAKVTSYMSNFSTGTHTNTIVADGGYVNISCPSNNIVSLTENFEDGTYVFDMTGDWLPTTNTPYAGTKCYKNKAIGDSQTSSVQINVTSLQAGNVSFWYRTSTEANYDKLKFYIDGTEELGGKSGNIGWTQATYALTVGTHTLKWEYSKDGFGSSGEDSVYIDDVTISGIGGYYSSANYVSSDIDLSSIGIAENSQISWAPILPSNTAITVETNLSIDSGATWQGWQSATNGGNISGITLGTNLSTALLRYRATLTTTDATVTPQLYDVVVNIKESDAAPIITGVAEGGIYNTSRTITFDKGTATLNGGAFTSGSQAVAEGTHTLVVTYSGNDTTIHFTIDKTAPIDPVISANPTTPTGGSVTITITYAGDASVKVYTIDGGESQTYSAPFTVAANCTVYAGSQDAAGNWSGEVSYVVSNITTPLVMQGITTMSDAVKDLGNDGDARDIRVMFKGATSEKNILEYRVIVVRSAVAGAFNLSTASGLASTSYAVDPIKGRLKIHLFHLPQTLQNSEGNPITGGVAYTVYVLAVGKNGYADVLNSIGTVTLDTNNEGYRVTASKPTVMDTGNNGNGTDIKVTFRKSKSEANVQEYRVIVSTTTLTLVQAQSVLAAGYKSITPTNPKLSYIVTLGAVQKISDGVTAIQNGTAYKIYILAIGKNGYANVLSAPSNAITLSQYVPGPLVVRSLKATKVGIGHDSSNIKVTFYEPIAVSNIQEYRVFIAPSANTLNQTTAEGIVDTNLYQVIATTGKGTLHSVTLDAGKKDYTSAALAAGNYKVYVLTVGKTGYANKLSVASGNVTLN